MFLRGKQGKAQGYARGGYARGIGARLPVKILDAMRAAQFCGDLSAQAGLDFAFEDRADRVDLQFSKGDIGSHNLEHTLLLKAFHRT